MVNRESCKVLIIDDDEYIRLSLKMFLDQHVEKVTPLESPGEIPATLESESYDIILLDMNFKQGDHSGDEGLKWLSKIKEISEDNHVILMTAYGGVNIAVEAIKRGAIDFIVKPWQNEKLLTTVLNAFQLVKEKRTVKKLQSQTTFISSTIDHQFVDIIGSSEPMRNVYKMIEKVAKTSADVLILGENGTGKELVARAIHRNSDRKEGAFISVDLGAVSETLFESELFGHKKGAFTDAKSDRMGRIEAASGGTLFFDEIGNLSPRLQVKLLTVLQNRLITPVGSNEERSVDVRIICATNSNLEEKVKAGEFREDLLYRIKTVEITLPPLRDRIEDIEELASHFGERYGHKYKGGSTNLPHEVINLLQQYSWPGNIRELQHAVERAVILGEDENLSVEDFSFLSPSSEGHPGLDNFNLTELEKWAVIGAIKKHRGNISHAAQELGLSRGAMYRRMEKYDL